MRDHLSGTDRRAEDATYMSGLASVIQGILYYYSSDVDKSYKDSRCKMVFCKIVKKASYSRYSQRWQVLHAIPSKCPSDMASLNEPLSETPLGALFVKTHILVIAAEAFKVYLKSTTYKFQLCRYIWKVATQTRIMGHDWLHCEQRAKLRKEKRAAKEQVVWFRWSWQLLATGVRYSRSRQVWRLLPRFWNTSSALWINTELPEHCTFILS